MMLALIPGRSHFLAARLVPLLIMSTILGVVECEVGT